MYKYVSTKMIFGIGLAIRNQQQTTASVAKKFFFCCTQCKFRKKNRKWISIQNFACQNFDGEQRHLAYLSRHKTNVRLCVWLAVIIWDAHTSYEIHKYLHKTRLLHITVVVGATDNNLAGDFEIVMRWNWLNKYGSEEVYFKIVML